MNIEKREFIGIENIMKYLSIQNKAIVILWYLEDFSMDEIATILQLEYLEVQEALFLIEYKIREKYTAEYSYQKIKEYITQTIYEQYIHCKLKKESSDRILSNVLEEYQFSYS